MEATNALMTRHGWNNKQNLPKYLLFYHPHIFNKRPLTEQTRILCQIHANLNAKLERFDQKSP